MFDYVSIYIASGCINAREVVMVMPAEVERCRMCYGNGKYRHYEDRLTWGCNGCEASGFVYRDTGRGVPFSVTNQIAVASGMEVKHLSPYGLDWRKVNGS